MPELSFANSSVMVAPFHFFRSRPRIHALLRWWAVMLLSGSAAIGAEVAKEYQIKAAFVYNFTKFVEWPAERFAGADDPIVIGILGKNPFGESLENAVRGRKIGGRDITVISLSPSAEQTHVHVLFVAAGEEKGFDPKMVAGALTVGESERFAALGGMITFMAETEKVRFVINLESAERAQLKLSAQLLKLASMVRRK